MSSINLSGSGPSGQYSQVGYPTWDASSSDTNQWEQGTPDYTWSRLLWQKILPEGEANVESIFFRILSKESAPV